MNVFHPVIEIKSISGMPKFLPSFPGKLLEEEISNLKNLYFPIMSRIICGTRWSKDFNKIKNILNFMLKTILEFL